MWVAAGTPPPSSAAPAAPGCMAGSTGSSARTHLLHARSFRCSRVTTPRASAFTSSTSSSSMPQTTTRSMQHTTQHAAAQRMHHHRPCVAARHQQHHNNHRRRQHPTHVCRVLTESADMAVGAAAPDFELLEPLTGRKLSLASLSSGAKATLVMFICNHCPFVVMLKDAIAKLAKEYQEKGVAVVAISSNSVQTHPQDGPDKMAEDAKKYGYTFPYLFDESQAVAKAYKAACTPEFYVFDSNLQLTYHGQFDDSRPNSNKLTTGSDLRAALDATLSGGGLPSGFKVKPSIGCNIKWTPGAEPDYYGTQIVKS